MFLVSRNVKSVMLISFFLSPPQLPPALPLSLPPCSLLSSNSQIPIVYTYFGCYTIYGIKDPLNAQLNMPLNVLGVSGRCFRQRNRFWQLLNIRNQSEQVFIIITFL